MALSPFPCGGHIELLYVIRKGQLEGSPEQGCTAADQTAKETYSDEGCVQREKMSRIAKGSGFREGELLSVDRSIDQCYDASSLHTSAGRAVAVGYTMNDSRGSPYARIRG
jgi:hypothetical protein